MKFKEGYKITNNRTELKAILEGIKKLEKEIEEGKEVIIHTDSMYCIQVITSENTYKKILKGKDTPNSDYIKKIYKCVNEYTNIKFHKVLAHTGKKDIHSIENENADRLANEAIKEEIGKIIISYGKYKGQTLNEIYEKDEKYLLWCIDNSKNQKHDIELFLDIICNKNIQIKNKSQKESKIDILEKDVLEKDILEK